MRVPSFIFIQSRGDLVARALWVLLGAVHIAPVLRLSTGLASGELESAKWLSLLAVTLSLLFFGLKAAGAPFLRVPCRGTGMVLFLVACGLLHGNATPHDWLEKTGYTTLAIAGVIGVQATIRIARKTREGLGWDEHVRESARRLLAMLVAAVLRSVAADLAFYRTLLGAAEARAGVRCQECVLARHGPPRGPPVLS